MGKLDSMADKVALVTGAARGIDLAPPMYFLSEVWCVVMFDRENEALMEGSTGLEGTRAFFLRCFGFCRWIGDGACSTSQLWAHRCCREQRRSC